jgi:hypothetical protein
VRIPCIAPTLSGLVCAAAFNSGACFTGSNANEEQRDARGTASDNHPESFHADSPTLSRHRSIHFGSHTRRGLPGLAPRGLDVTQVLDIHHQDVAGPAVP